MNLASNARDAMPTGGRLTIETQMIELDEEEAALRHVAAGRYASLVVTDTGIGMDGETQQRVFEPFFTTKEATGGSGIGLAIVHGIVTQARGTISVYSELGHGTTFRIDLPLSYETVLAAPRPSAQTTRVLPPMTVLVVDDQREVRAVAARALHDAGCRVLEAATGDEALAICVGHDGAIDVVVLDVVLPDMRGEDLVGQLRELRSPIAVVLMSGYPAGALGPTGGPPPELLPKPFTPAKLRASVAQATALAGPEPVSRVVEQAPAAARPARRRRCRAAPHPRARVAPRRLRHGRGDQRSSRGRGCGGRLVRRRDQRCPDARRRRPRAVARDPTHRSRRAGDPDQRPARRLVGGHRGGVRRVPLSRQAPRSMRSRIPCTMPRVLMSWLDCAARCSRSSGRTPGSPIAQAWRSWFEQARWPGCGWRSSRSFVDASSGIMFGVEALMRSTEPSMAQPVSRFAPTTRRPSLRQASPASSAAGSASLVGRAASPWRIPDDVNLFRRQPAPERPWPMSISSSAAAQR